MTSQPGRADPDEGPHTEPFVTIKMAAQRLAVSEGTIRNLIRTQNLIAYMFMRSYRIRKQLHNHEGN